MLLTRTALHEPAFENRSGLRGPDIPQPAVERKSSVNGRQDLSDSAPSWMSRLRRLTSPLGATSNPSANPYTLAASSPTLLHNIDDMDEKVDEDASMHDYGGDGLEKTGDESRVQAFGLDRASGLVTNSFTGRNDGPDGLGSRTTATVGDGTGLKQRVASWHHGDEFRRSVTSIREHNEDANGRVGNDAVGPARGLELPRRPTSEKMARAGNRLTSNSFKDSHARSSRADRTRSEGLKPEAMFPVPGACATALSRGNAAHAEKVNDTLVLASGLELPRRPTSEKMARRPALKKDEVSKNSRVPQSPGSFLTSPRTWLPSFPLPSPRGGRATDEVPLIASVEMEHTAARKGLRQESGRNFKGALGISSASGLEAGQQESHGAAHGMQQDASSVHESGRQRSASRGRDIVTRAAGDWAPAGTAEAAAAPPAAATESPPPLPGPWEGCGRQLSPRESAQRISHLSQSLAQGGSPEAKATLVLCGRTGNILWASDRACAMLGVAPGKATGLALPESRESQGPKGDEMVARWKNSVARITAGESKRELASLEVPGSSSPAAPRRVLQLKLYPLMIANSRTELLGVLEAPSPAAFSAWDQNPVAVFDPTGTWSSWLTRQASRSQGVGSEKLRDQASRRQQTHSQPTTPKGMPTFRRKDTR